MVRFIDCPGEERMVMAIPLNEATLEALSALVAAAAAEGDLRGLDYFTVQQAARFCGLKETAFRERAEAVRIPVGTALGTRKPVYRRADLVRAMEWHGFGQSAGSRRPPSRCLS